ncbi:hypothetical protein ACQEU6_45135 [Spirillospora sp. CA-108201]
MPEVRVMFERPQTFGSVTVSEMRVEADRLVLVNAGAVALDVAVTEVRSVDWGTGARAERLRALFPNHGKPWTTEEDAELRRMWEAGTPKSELVKHFGRSPGGVRSALLRLGLVQRVPLPRER